MNFFAKFKFHILMVFGQMSCVFSYFITISSFNRGMRPEVYTTYRLAVGSVILLPFALLMERGQQPRFTAGLLCKICVLALLGYIRPNRILRFNFIYTNIVQIFHWVNLCFNSTSLPLITFYEGMRCTSPTVASAVNNTIPATVFVLAVLRRMETLDIRSLRGTNKVIGSILCLAGVTIMTIYKGHKLNKFKGAPIRMEQKKMHEDWIRGSILVAISCLSFSLSYILQAMTLLKYPAQLSLAVWMNIIGWAMSAVFAGVVTIDEPNAWAIGFDIRLWSVLYGGLLGSGYLICVQLWCTKEKGAVFMTMFNPLTTLMSAFVSYFLVGSNLYTGSIMGAAVVVVGLYCLLWGKSGEKNDNAQTYKHQEQELGVDNAKPEIQEDKVFHTSGTHEIRGQEAA